MLGSLPSFYCTRENRHSGIEVGQCWATCRAQLLSNLLFQGCLTTPANLLLLFGFGINTSSTLPLTISSFRASFARCSPTLHAVWIFLMTVIFNTGSIAGTCMSAISRSGLLCRAAAVVAWAICAAVASSHRNTPGTLDLLTLPHGQPLFGAYIATGSPLSKAGRSARNLQFRNKSHWTVVRAITPVPITPRVPLWGLVEICLPRRRCAWR